MLLYVVNLASAACLAAFPAWELASTFGRRPALREAADGVDVWMAIESLMFPVSGEALGVEGAAAAPARWLAWTTIWAIAVVLLLPPVAWLPADLLYGGLVLTYTEAPAPFRWRRFLWGCWRWFGPFILLDGVQGAVLLLLALPLTIAALAASLFVGRWLGWMLRAALLMLLAAWTLWAELSRVVAVVEPTCNIFRAMRRAARFIRRHFRAVVMLYAAAFVLLGAFHLLYRWAFKPYLPLHWWLLVLMVQQAFVLARLWARLARTAGGAALYQTAQAGEDAA